MIGTQKCQVRWGLWVFWVMTWSMLFLDNLSADDEMVAIRSSQTSWPTQGLSLPPYWKTQTMLLTLTGLACHVLFRGRWPRPHFLPQSSHAILTVTDSLTSGRTVDQKRDSWLINRPVTHSLAPTMNRANESPSSEFQNTCARSQLMGKAEAKGLCFGEELDMRCR